MSKEYETHLNNLTLALLSEPERQLLHKSLQRFQKNKDVAKFSLTVREICNTAEKAKLLDYIRGYIPRPDKAQFDKLTAREYMPSMTANSRPNFFGRITTPPSTVLSTSTERLVTIYGSRGDSMGFSIRGGSEFGLGIYVSNVKPGTPAAEAGLRAGDHIVTANGIDFHCVANSSAVKVLSSSALLNLIVIRVGKIPEWKVARERVLWYDVSLSRIVSNPPVSETRAINGQHNVLVERKLVIAISKESDFIGLNIRGGKEYGIGIYVSRVDAGGLASQVGLSAGDQIVRVNDTDCLSVTHSDAVDALRASAHLIVTIRSVGKYPVFKELYAEYTWSDASSLSTTTSGVIVRSRLVTAPGDSSSGIYSHRTQTRESSIDISPTSFIRSNSDNIINSSYLEDHIDELDDSIDGESQVCLPGDKDIMFRRNYEDSWQEIDALSDYSHPDYMAKSWSADKVDSLHHYRQDSDLSDHVLDYTTFLEQTALKDQQELKTKQQQVETSSLLKNENVVIETVIEEKVTSFASNPRASSSSYSETDKHLLESSSNVYSQVQDLTGKARPNQAGSSPSSSVHSAPIYATVNKKPSNKVNESTKMTVIGNGIYTGSSRKDDSDETKLQEVIESQIERLEARKSHLGSWEITRVTEGSVSSKGSSSTSHESHDKNKVGTWTSLKKKLKGSLRITGPGQKKRSSMPDMSAYSGNGTSSAAGSSQQKGVFERSFGSQILNTQNSDRYNLMGMLEDHARVLLTQDEYKAVLRHIHNYHENKQLERLVELLLAILDKQKKMLLLVDVRNVIAPSHISRFDTLVAHCNIQGYDQWVTKFNSIVETPHNQTATSKNPANSHDVSKSYINNGEPNSSNHVVAFSRKDFENLPGSLEVVVLETDDAEIRKTSVVEAGEEIVYISKHKTILGLEICGGRNDYNDQSIRVKKVIADGAASDDKRLKPGVQITKVDGKSLEGLSCEEAKSMLQIAFSIKVPVNLGIQIRRA